MRLEFFKGLLASSTFYACNAALPPSLPPLHEKVAGVTSITLESWEEREGEGERGEESS